MNTYATNLRLCTFIYEYIKEEEEEEKKETKRARERRKRIVYTMQTKLIKERTG